jgi:hypothetical protein
MLIRVHRREYESHPMLFQSQCSGYFLRFYNGEKVPASPHPFFCLGWCPLPVSTLQLRPQQPNPNVAEPHTRSKKTVLFDSSLHKPHETRIPQQPIHVLRN